MTRAPRGGFSVSRRMSERARAGQDPAPHTESVEIGGLSGIFDALKGMVEQFAATARDHAGTDRTDDGKTQAVFGYSVRMGRDGISAEPFGDMPTRPGKADPQPAADEAPAARQPIVEVFEEGDTIVVVAELPGADPAGIACSVEGASLMIEASGTRRYRKALVLPAPVQAASLVQSFRNGILEVRMKRDPAA
jgi:HSP20 family protein